MASADFIKLNPQFAKLLSHVDDFRSTTEAHFAAWLTAQGRSWLYEPLTLHLAKRLEYTPDFSYIDDEGVLVLVEVKGSKNMRGARAARIAWKAAAERFYFFRWAWVEPTKAHGWKFEYYRGEQ